MPIFLIAFSQKVTKELFSPSVFKILQFKLNTFQLDFCFLICHRTWRPLITYILLNPKASQFSTYLFIRTTGRTHQALIYLLYLVSKTKTLLVSPGFILSHWPLLTSAAWFSSSHSSLKFLPLSTLLANCTDSVFKMHPESDHFSKSKDPDQSNYNLSWIFSIV